MGTLGSFKGATTISMMTLSITTFSITTLSIKGLHVTLSMRDTAKKQHSA
jgi:hypothetical protein